MTKNVLFITWDGPQTNYLESLFFPTLAGLQKVSSWKFSVLQFSWADKTKQDQIGKSALKNNIEYTHYPISRKPHPIWGTVKTLYLGSKFLEEYLRQNHIHVLMPRSTIPAMLVTGIRQNNSDIKIVFDADGLPLEERVDFSGLNPKGIQYRYLKIRETQMLRMADLVLTRSDKASQIHLLQIGDEHQMKFFTVSNGRDPAFFKINAKQRESFRAKLNLSPQQLCMVYCGSLGPQYGWNTMMEIFIGLLQTNPDSKFLILTQEDALVRGHIPENLLMHIIIIKGPYSDIPCWLNAGDIAFAIREPTFSMQGVAPIKIGEYFLMGLPTIASKGIGDTEKLLKGQSFVHLYDPKRKEEMNNILSWVESTRFLDKEEIRKFAMANFSLERSITDYQNAFDYLAPMVTLCM